jgi:hypothetical protein
VYEAVRNMVEPPGLSSVNTCPQNASSVMNLIFRKQGPRRAEMRIGVRAEHGGTAGSQLRYHLSKE